MFGIKQQYKKELETAYLSFYRKYNPDIHRFGSAILDRMEDRHYKLTTMKRIIFVMDWFAVTYPKEGYIINFAFYSSRLCAHVADPAGNQFATYVYCKEKMYLSKADTELLESILIRDGLYDTEMHKIAEPYQYFESREENKGVAINT